MRLYTRLKWLSQYYISLYYFSIIAYIENNFFTSILYSGIDPYWHKALFDSTLFKRCGRQMDVKTTSRAFTGIWYKVAEQLYKRWTAVVEQIWTNAG